MKSAHSLLLLLVACAQVHAAVIYEQPASTTSGTAYRSATGTICTAHNQQRIWEKFVVPTTQTIREIQWRGTYRSLSPAQFVVQNYNPLLSGHSYLNERPAAFFVTPGNADETPAGSVGGVPVYSYRFALPTPFTAVANQNYELHLCAPARRPRLGLSNQQCQRRPSVADGRDSALARLQLWRRCGPLGF